MQVCTSLQTDNHTSTPLLSFLQAGCPSCRPTNSVKALKAEVHVQYETVHLCELSKCLSPSLRQCTELENTAQWQNNIHHFTAVTQITLRQPAARTSSYELQVQSLTARMPAASTRVEGWGDEPCEPTVRLPD